MTRQAVIHWRGALKRDRPSLLPAPGSLPDLVRELVYRLKTEWPRWGTRRIAGLLARMGVRASRSSVQRILRRPRNPAPNDSVLVRVAPGLLAQRPDHIWMIDFTRLGGLVRPAFVGAVLDACSRRVLAIRLLRRAIARHGVPTWLVSDRDRAFRNRRVSEFLRQHGIGRRYGAVGHKGSIALIERFWRSMKQEYVNGILLYRAQVAIETRLRRYARWYNRERPHWGLANRTPDEVHRQRPAGVARRLTTRTFSVRFLDGDRRLPILRLAA